MHIGAASLTLRATFGLRNTHSYPHSSWLHNFDVTSHGLEMASPGAPFVYTPLQPGEIRLLYPDFQSSSEPHWVLKVVQLRDQLGTRTSLEYDALSYT